MNETRGNRITGKTVTFFRPEEMFRQKSLVLTFRDICAPRAWLEMRTTTQIRYLRNKRVTEVQHDKQDRGNPCSLQDLHEVPLLLE